MMKTTKLLRQLETLGRIHDFACKVCFGIGSVSLFVLVISIGYEVTVRYFFMSPTVWAQDLSSYILIYSTFLAAPWLLLIDGHVTVPIIVDNMPPKARQRLGIFNYAMGLIVSGILTYQTFIDTQDAFVRNVRIIRPIIVKKYIILAVMPLGFGLLFFAFLRKLFNAIGSNNRSEAM